MFCPSCGLEDTQSNQYCRSCGTDLGSVNTVLGTPRNSAGTTLKTRDEIGRALAAKIKQTESSEELSTFAKKVLPDVEKFLETPEERKMRRIRTGSITAFVGIGVAIGFFLASIFGADPEIVILSAMGLVAFCVGLALIINGRFFSVPDKAKEDQNSFLETADSGFQSLNPTTNDLLMPPAAKQEFSSVTESTTRQLKKEEKS